MHKWRGCDTIKELFLYVKVGLKTVKIAVLLSGGVDSSVALALLKGQGHDVKAFYLKIWLEDELSFLGSCPWQEDLEHAQAVCKQLGVPLEVMSLQREYHDTVVSYTIAEVKAGRTPNPDILCNSRIKFGFFLDRVGAQFDAIATGHYAQIRCDNDGMRLLQAPDPVKDQSYFLSHLTQAQLAKVLFPIGHLIKKEVRQLACDFGLATQDRKDSQGICFLGKLKFSDFLRCHIGERVGALREYETGELRGHHKGFWFYTIGQRQGLGLAGGPWYVVSKDAAKNIVYISRFYYTDDKKRNQCLVDTLNWINKPALPADDLKVKVRHGAQIHHGRVAAEGNTVRVIFDQDDQGLAPGQFAVFYRDGECLGGGTIEETLVTRGRIDSQDCS